MSRARNIKPGFFRNDLLGELDPLARLLFIALWTYADREGRLQDRPKKIRGELLPYDNVDADPLLQSLHDSGFIVRYEVDGSKYIEIVNFKKHQNPHLKEIKSIIPPMHSDSLATTFIQCSSASDANLVQEPDDSEDCMEQEVGLSDVGFEPASDKTGTNTEPVPDKTGTSTELAPDKTGTSTETALNHPGLIPLILDSLIPSTNVEIYIPHDKKTRRGKKLEGFPDEFESFWLVYPRKMEKVSALKAWNARIREKVKPEDLIKAARNYADDCLIAKRDILFTKHPATFLGPDKVYEDFLKGTEISASGGKMQQKPQEIPKRNNFDQRTYDDKFFDNIAKSFKG